MNLRIKYNKPIMSEPNQLSPPPASTPFGVLVNEEISGGIVHRSYQLNDEWRAAMQEASKRGAESKRLAEKSALSDSLILIGCGLFVAILIFACGFAAGLAAQQLGCIN